MKKTNWSVKVDGKGHSVTEIIDKFWKSRNIDNSTEFLLPHGNILPSTDLKNISKAATAVMNNIISKSKFMIYADVDADGCSSAAILYHYLRAHGCTCC